MIELLTESQGRDNVAVARLTPPDPREAGVFDGALASPFVGIKHAWDIGAAGLADAVMPTLDKYTPEAASDWFKEQRSVAFQSMKDTRADPMNMGAVAQVGHALGSVLTMGLAGGLIAGPVGAAAAIGGGSMYDKYKELRDQKVDEATALDVAGVTGAVMAASAALPAFMGKTITTQVLSGIGMNVPLGLVERGGSSELLENAGYAEMAKHYKALDGAAIAVDVVLGAAFPLGARALRKNVPVAEVDAAMDANRTIANDNVHPALPGTLEDAAAVKAAEDSFAKQLLEEGKSLEEIDVPRGLYESSVENTAVAKAAADTVTSFDELAAKEGYSPLKKMESDVDSMGRAYAETMSINENQFAVYRGLTQKFDETLRQDIEFWSPDEIHAEKYSSQNGEVVSSIVDRSNLKTIKESDYSESTLASAFSDSEYAGVRVVDESGKEIIIATFDRPIINKSLEAKQKNGTEGKKIDTYTSDRASNIVAQKEGMTVVDDNGQVVKASDMVAKAEAEFKQEQKEIDLYKVAIECAVRVGA